jgi:integrase
MWERCGNKELGSPAMPYRTALEVKQLDRPGRHSVGENLHLLIKKSGKRTWVVRLIVNGRRRDLGLGRQDEVSLSEARNKAREAIVMARQGLLPSTTRKAAPTPTEITPSIPQKTFRLYAGEWIATQSPGWKNAKHAAQWTSTLETYAYPVIGDLGLDEITTEHIETILKPIWATKQVTASRVQQRIERILSAAITLGYRKGDNPARWKGHLSNLLHKPRKANKTHFRRLPYQKVPGFIERLQGYNCLAALALEFCILTASRTSEVLQAKRSEINGNLWQIPAERMKAGKPHEVPLTARCLILIERAAARDPESEYLFSTRGKPLSTMAMLQHIQRMGDPTTVHGFRSSFRDWVSDCTEYHPEIAEAALAHTISDKTIAAYKRNTALDKRRELMNVWMNYCLELN